MTDTLKELDDKIAALRIEEAELHTKQMKVQRSKRELHREKEALLTKQLGYIVGEKLYVTPEYADAVHSELPYARLPQFYILAAVENEEGALSVYNPNTDIVPFYGNGGTYIPRWQAQHLRRSGEIVEVQPEPKYRD